MGENWYPFQLCFRMKRCQIKASATDTSPTLGGEAKLRRLSPVDRKNSFKRKGLDAQVFQKEGGIPLNCIDKVCSLVQRTIALSLVERREAQICSLTSS